MVARHLCGSRKGHEPQVRPFITGRAVVQGEIDAADLILVRAISLVLRFEVDAVHACHVPLPTANEHATCERLNAATDGGTRIEKSGPLLAVRCPPWNAALEPTGVDTGTGDS